MIRLLKVATMVSALSSLAAEAQTCPDFDDLNSGVRVYLSSGGYNDVVRAENGTVIVRGHNVSGEHYETFEYTQNVLEARYSEYEPTDVIASYEVEFYYLFENDMKPSPKSEFRGMQYVKDSHGEHYENGYQIGFSSAKSISIGQCDYEYLTVRKRYTWADDSDEAIEMYLPKLGLLFDIDPSISFNRKLLEEGSISQN